MFLKALVPENYDWQPYPPLNTPSQNPHVARYITIDVNQYWIDNKKLDDHHITYALAHEIGHALGLAHSDVCHIDSKSIMKSGGEDVPKRTVITPQDYDKMELEQIYGRHVS